MYAEFEGALGELSRARAIFSLAIGLNTTPTAEGNSIQIDTTTNANQPPNSAPQIALDMPEKVWKSYIDFEVEGG